MGDKTGIEWTDHTFNPWWGCARVSPACVHCYAATTAARYSKDDLWRRHGPRRMMADSYWRAPIGWNRKAKEAGQPARVFCASMADVFEVHPEPDVQAQLDTARARLWELIDATPWLTWQLLTKRVEHVMELAPYGSNWPANVWIGTSVESQRWADARIPTLLRIPAAQRFLSCEPLIESVDLRNVKASNGALIDCLAGDVKTPAGEIYAACPNAVNWVIVGGESGKNARPMDPLWVARLRNPCVANRVPFFFKQWGEWAPFNGRMHRVGKKLAGRRLDGITWNDFPALFSPEVVTP